MTGIGLSLDRVAKTFAPDVQAVAPLSLEIPPGQFIALLGPSGCGKSTLLRMIAGLENPTQGTTLRSVGILPTSLQTETGRGQDAHATNRNDTAFVFQDAHLMPWRTVLRNVALPLELAGVDRKTREAAAVEQLHLVGLSDFIHRYPAQLSGGMKMRVSLARALVMQPSLLLLDEPFAALDEITRQQLDDLLRSLWQRAGMTVIFVTHSIHEAVYLADRAIVFSQRPARVMLDHDLAQALPSLRSADIRTTTLFADESSKLFTALQAGERA